MPSASPLGLLGDVWNELVHPETCRVRLGPRDGDQDIAGAPWWEPNFPGADTVSGNNAGETPEMKIWSYSKLIKWSGTLFDFTFDSFTIHPCPTKPVCAATELSQESKGFTSFWTRVAVSGEMITMSSVDSDWWWILFAYVIYFFDIQCQFVFAPVLIHQSWCIVAFTFEHTKIKNLNHQRSRICIQYQQLQTYEGLLLLMQEILHHLGCRKPL